MRTSNDWREQPTTIAIRDKDSEQWEYQVFATWNEARKALNRAREDGKVAIVYEGGSPDVSLVLKVNCEYSTVFLE